MKNGKSNKPKLANRIRKIPQKTVDRQGPKRRRDSHRVTEMVGSREMVRRKNFHSEVAIKMVRLKGPLHSERATKQFAKSITYADDRYRRYAYHYHGHRIKYKNTPKQKLVKQAMKEEIAHWRSLTDSQKQEWNEWFDPRQVRGNQNLWFVAVDGYHLFIACNVQRKLGGKSVVDVPSDLWT